MGSAWLDVDWDAHRRRAMIDGSEIEYVDLGSGPPLVFVHGLGASWQSWLRTLPALAETHRCIALDLPGFGASTPVAGKVSIERFARVVAQLMQRLETGPAVVAGNSMGGFIALELALRRPELVDALVLVSPAVFWQEYRHARALVALALPTGGVVGRIEPLLARRRLRAFALGMKGVAAPAALPHDLQKEILRTARRTPGYLPALRALASHPLRAELPGVGCPALIVWGTRDPLVGVAHADELAALLPDARIAIHEDAGHLVMLEAPAWFNREVRDFVAARPASGRSS